MRMGELGGGLGRRDGDEVGRGTEMRSGPGEFWLRLEKTFEESRLGGGEGHILLRGGGVERGWGSFYTATPLEVRLRGGGTLARSGRFSRLSHATFLASIPIIIIVQKQLQDHRIVSVCK